MAPFRTFTYTHRHPSQPQGTGHPTTQPPCCCCCCHQTQHHCQPCQLVPLTSCFAPGEGEGKPTLHPPLQSHEAADLPRGGPDTRRAQKNFLLRELCQDKDERRNRSRHTCSPNVPHPPASSATTTTTFSVGVGSPAFLRVWCLGPPSGKKNFFLPFQKTQCTTI